MKKPPVNNGRNALEVHCVGEAKKEAETFYSKKENASRHFHLLWEYSLKKGPEENYRLMARGTREVVEGTLDDVLGKAYKLCVLQKWAPVNNP